MDISPKQMVGVSAGLIPFLEHDDANRALMGSNMQRQAVPLLVAEPPIVATGLEKAVAINSGMVVKAQQDGTVTYVDSTRIIIDHNHIYKLRKYVGLNERTCLNQKPIVQVGQKVKKGEILADGAATYQGELALGRNVLVAFMAWDGYNFEDAIIISEKLVKDDVYTSIHIEEFEIEIRETKLGREEFTRDIPNVSEKALRNLDENGVVRIGTYVKPGDILVGKVVAEEQERADARREAAARDLRPGRRGRQERLARGPLGRRGDRDQHPAVQPPDEPERGRAQGLREGAQGHRGRRERQDRRRVQADDQGARGGRSAARSPTRRPASRWAAPRTPRTWPRRASGSSSRRSTSAAPRRSPRPREVVRQYAPRIEALSDEKERRLNSLKRGDELPSGVLQMVKVYIATKRVISVGDKMAGRHGNKGVIAKILPEEDMPFLADGTAVEILLNPLGVPEPDERRPDPRDPPGLGRRQARLPGRSARSSTAPARRRSASASRTPACPRTARPILYDGRTGEQFDQRVTVGYIYMLKLHHLVDDKIHARATGPYSLITQQPLGGKARFGGQRFGEMEVWALEAYGAAYILQELLTVKSDDVEGRTKIYESDGQGREHPRSRHPRQLRRPHQRDPRPRAQHAAREEADLMRDGHGHRARFDMSNGHRGRCAFSVAIENACTSMERCHVE